jgi:flagellar biosynthesis/type III secretory pathway M-ring protein FliF/YscJ
MCFAVIAALSGQAVAGNQEIQIEMEQRIQVVLDHVAGVDRTAVRVEVLLSASEAAGRPVGGRILDLLDEQGIQRVRLEVTIDPQRPTIDATSGQIAEVGRSPVEVQALVSIVESMAGLNRDLGDELILITQSFSEVRDRNRQSAEVAKRAQQELEQREFWTRIGIIVAKVVGVIVALILLRGAIILIGRYGP